MSEATICGGKPLLRIDPDTSEDNDIYLKSKLMAYSREIVKKITQYIRFRVPRTNEKDS